MSNFLLLEGGVDTLLAEGGVDRFLQERDGVPAALQASVTGSATVTAALTTAGAFPWTAMPQFSGADQGAYWLRPGGTAVRDNQGAHDLVMLGHTYAGGSNAIHLATSVDGGGSWVWTASAVNLGVGTLASGGGIQYVVQDSGGVLHCTFRLASGTVYYFRGTLTRDGSGHVTGLASTSTAVDLTSLTGPNGGDYRCAPHIVLDATPAERLVVTIFGDGANSGQYVWLAKASSLTPSALSDFSDLSGTASTASLVINQTTAGGGAYDHAHGLAQLGSTKDLYLACASVIAEPAPTVATDLVWVRLTASGSTWTVGSTTTHAVSGGCWFGGLVGLSDRVLVGYIPAVNGTGGAPTFRKWNAGGTLSDPGIGSPTLPSFTDATSSLMTFNATEDGRVWCVFTRNSTTDTPPVNPEPNGWGKGNFTKARWNGSAWVVNSTETSTSRFDPANFQSNAYGLGGLVDPAFEGVIGVVSNCQGTNFSGTLVTLGIYGGDLVVGGGAAALQASVAGAASVQAALTTGIQLQAAVAGGATLTAALTVAKPLAAAVAAPAVATAALTTGIQLAAGVAAAGSVQAALTSGIRLAADVAGAGSVVTAALTTGGGSAALAAAISGGASLSATLTTGITLAASTAAGATVQATLSTGIPLQAAVAGSASVSASLTTGIRLQAGVAAGAAVTADLTAGGGAAQLQAAVVAGASVTANLTQLSAALAASVAGSASVQATLTTGIPLAAGVSAPATVTAALSTGIRLAAGVAAGASVTAALTTQPAGLGADVVGASSLSASLSTGIALAANVQGAAAGSGSLTTSIRLAAAVQGGSSSTASLTTFPAGLAASVSAAGSLQATLTTAIRLAAAVAAGASVSASLTTTATVIPWAYPGVLALADFPSTPGATATGQGAATAEVL